MPSALTPLQDLFQLLRAAIPEKVPKNVLLLTTLKLHKATEEELVNSDEF